MNSDERAAIAQAFIDHLSNPLAWDQGMVLTKRDNSSTQWAMDKILDLTFEAPHELWELILEILNRDPPDDVKEVLAAGPLEDYLAKCGEMCIGQVEEQAAKDPKFRDLLGGVWQNAMSEEVWTRVQACRDRSGWDNGI